MFGKKKLEKAIEENMCKPLNETKKTTAIKTCSRDAFPLIGHIFDLLGVEGRQCYKNVFVGCFYFNPKTGNVMCENSLKEYEYVVVPHRNKEEFNGAKEVSAEEFLIENIKYAVKNKKIDAEKILKNARSLADINTDLSVVALNQKNHGRISKLVECYTNKRIQDFNKLNFAGVEAVMFDGSDLFFLSESNDINIRTGESKTRKYVYLRETNEDLFYGRVLKFLEKSTQHKYTLATKESIGILRKKDIKHKKMLLDEERIPFKYIGVNLWGNVVVSDVLENDRVYLENAEFVEFLEKEFKGFEVNK